MSTLAFQGDVSDLKYGFIPLQVHENLQSMMFADRVEAAKQLLQLTNSVAMRYVDLGNFLIFIGPYLHDENFEVCTNVEFTIEALIQKFGSQSLYYIDQLKSIIFPALRDIRRAVRIITVNMMVTYSLETQSFILLQTALDEFDRQPNLAKAELLTYVNSLIERIKPPESYFKPISSMLDSAFMVQNGQVRSSAILLLQCFVKLAPSIRQILTEQCESFLLDDIPKQIVPSTPKVNSPSIPMNGMSPRGNFMKKFPQTPRIEKNQIAYEITEFGKPRISKTANDIFAIAKKQIIVTPKLQGSPIARPIIESFIQEPIDDNIFRGNSIEHIPIMNDSPPQSPKFEPIFAQSTAPHAQEVNNSSSEADNIDFPPIITSTHTITISSDDLPELKSERSIHDTFSKQEFPIKPDFNDDPPKPEPNHISFAIVEPKAENLFIDDLSSDTGTYNRNRIRRRPRPPVLNIQPSISAFQDAETPQPKKYDVQEPSLHVKPMKVHASTPRNYHKYQKPPKIPQNQAKSPRKIVKELAVDDIISDLRSSEWEKQNEAALYLSKLIVTNTSFVRDNLRVFVFELFPLTTSIRSALAKTALSCMKDLAENFGNEFTPFFEATLNELLTVILSSKIFINKLASDCIDLILEGINRKTAIDFLLQDHSKRPTQCRVSLSYNFSKLCDDINDPNAAVKSLGMFITDASPDVRKNARNAITKMSEKFHEFKYIISNSSINDAEKKALLNCF
ncbi:hypothetical protein TVAG_163220 [Trichomonas vaginalis G3]|uniref:TOG domain-containing protein n=1 Tax=Trichomonas vaginalis (strain ATCC PRA-98 / G3) TaxID=412133 RepID=A2DFZ9_TRIV3|nr:hypothetical protein TVAGG3_0952990 [Trichomonas vaginalis G3]EAY20626.1 hypothetical protein TVAG_163220 [Trichomonas vaginalis G3]KAI5487341.1 hypothetical protein TVAGG3_0952990 [Trichomonas vaginalis G3]|eukprot:XP_001581612.1 hypothetical protein [Trichomonas vaginalis G3]